MDASLTLDDQLRAALPDLAGEVWQAAETLREATEALLAMSPQDRFAGAVPYLRAFALVLYLLALYMGGKALG